MSSSIENFEEVRHDEGAETEESEGHSSGAALMEARQSPPPGQATELNEQGTDGAEGGQVVPLEVVAAPDEVLCASIDSFHKEGNGLSAHVLYRVSYRTSLSHFGASYGRVQRRYNDFKWLAGSLYNECVI